MPHQGRQLKEAVDRYKSKDPGKPSKITGFAEQMGISRQWAYSYFEKERLDPDIRKRAAAVLDIPEKELFTFNDNETALQMVGEDFITRSGNRLEYLGDGLYRLHTLLVDQKHHPRYLTSWGDNEYLGALKSYSVVIDTPAQGIYRAFQVPVGDTSMQNPASSYSIEPGDIVTGRLLNRSLWAEHLNFESHPYWVIVHRDHGVIIREIILHNSVSGMITCRSNNPQQEQFPELILDLEDVIQLYNIIRIEKDFP
jgi:hypothetical protein